MSHAKNVAFESMPGKHKTRHSSLDMPIFLLLSLKLLALRMYIRLGLAEIMLRACRAEMQYKPSGS